MNNLQTRAPTSFLIQRTRIDPKQTIAATALFKRDKLTLRQRTDQTADISQTNTQSDILPGRRGNRNNVDIPLKPTNLLQGIQAIDSMYLKPTPIVQRTPTPINILQGIQAMDTMYLPEAPIANIQPTPNPINLLPQRKAMDSISMYQPEPAILTKPTPLVMIQSELSTSNLFAGMQAVRSDPLQYIPSPATITPVVRLPGTSTRDDVTIPTPPIPESRNPFVVKPVTPSTVIEAVKPLTPAIDTTTKTDHTTEILLPPTARSTTPSTVLDQPKLLFTIKPSSPIPFQIEPPKDLSHVIPSSTTTATDNPKSLFTITPSILNESFHLSSDAPFTTTTPPKITTATFPETSILTPKSIDKLTTAPNIDTTIPLQAQEPAFLQLPASSYAMNDMISKEFAKMVTSTVPQNVANPFITTASTSTLTVRQGAGSVDQNLDGNKTNTVLRSVTPDINSSTSVTPGQERKGQIKATLQQARAILLVPNTTNFALQALVASLCDDMDYLLQYVQ
jgi:hypothetical protein